MALVYNFKNILACIETLHPIQACRIQELAEARIRQFGEVPDPDACRWTSQKPGNCNIGAIENVIINMTDIGELQQIEDCARLICVLDDEESSMSTSSTSDGTSASSVSTSSVDDFCRGAWDVPTPQRFETDTSTSPVEMFPLDGNDRWQQSIDDGYMEFVVLDQSGTGFLVGPVSLEFDLTTGGITFTPNQSGGQAGTFLNIKVRAFDGRTFCDSIFYLHIVITEETSTET